MTNNTNVKTDAANSNLDKSVASAVTKIQPEPVTLHVRTAVKAGYSSRVGKHSPLLV